jgi:hypothetical protein
LVSAGLGAVPAIVPPVARIITWGIAAFCTGAWADAAPAARASHVMTAKAWLIAIRAHGSRLNVEGFITIAIVQ